ncbi:MAG: crossover junction endodeoxyribonuclease RuvC [Chitinophagia bacterium]|nr:crossover junction endodeoxyribonuclease RuvC [Chitinophagia bacterium]
MGYALLEVGGATLRMVEMESVRLDTRLEMFDRLSSVHEVVHGLILRHRPQQLAIEAPFHGKNVQSMLKLGRAQGVVIAAALAERLPVAEYSPRSIKQAVTGNGNATKERVWLMLQHTLGIRMEMTRMDASDALAVAVCHHYAETSPVPESRKKGGAKPRGKGGWETFVKENPGRIA